ncbi:MazG nucleotide pyrophosphohydrolase domain-containing protein [Halonatronum saccharophilum]|uniref:MazG nucleotide pyrophosphohydrolase domain-containing protein n=1 Tax=Halonatronum saccharophilum TaxID=150060 RepID=UPI00047F26F4|nr:MazG nucleotide pyrophosphohydrolase domain-containing protein [Halonatronum saccharophilum]
MEEKLTIEKLQSYIKDKDYNPDLKQGYFMKLIEEIGELAEVIRKERKMDETNKIKGTIEEELYDVLYYIVALANVYDIDLEECFYLKETINNQKYG